eukprot:Ihof_evm3s469 gene=Ihof_evmTU3s469
MWVTVVLLILVVVCLILYLDQRPPVDRKIPLAPGSLPVIGHIHHLLSNVNKGDTYKVHVHCRDTIGSVYRLKKIRRNTIMFIDPKLARAVLSDNVNFEFPHYFTRIFSTLGSTLLLIMNGPEWKRHRKLIQPTFGTTQLPLVRDITNSEMSILLKKWRSAANCQVNLKKDLASVSMNVIGQLSLSTRFEEGGTWITAINQIFEALNRRIHCPIPVVWRLLGIDNNAVNESILTLRGVMYDLLASHANDLTKKVPKESKSKIRDVVSAMLATQKEESVTGVPGLTNDEIVDQTFMLFLAGYETTSTCLFWTMYSLAMNPDVQAALQEEVDRVLQGRQPTMEDIPKMPYVDCVIKESLRLFPPGPAFARQATVTTQVGDYVISEGDEIGISVYGIHTHPDYWVDPLVYNPDRWKDLTSTPDAFMPFGFGPKMCLGWRVAMTEMACFLSCFAQEFTVSLEKDEAEKCVPFQEITLICKNDVSFTMTPRT